MGSDKQSNEQNENKSKVRNEQRRSGMQEVKEEGMDEESSGTGFWIENQMEAQDEVHREAERRGSVCTCVSLDRDERTAGIMVIILEMCQRY